MAPALSTTKRKFHKILDSISNASTPSLVLKEKQNENGSATTLPANLDRPAKKPRITRPNSAIVLSTTFHAGKQAPKTAKPSFSSATMDEDRKPPNFAPWDRAQFLERLKTFRQVDKWMGKPEKINEVQWAKRGWSCVGKERVGCVGGCGKEVVIKLEEDRLEEECEAEELSGDEDQDWRENAQMQLIEKYSELIIKEHDGGCLWRRRGCDDTIHRLPLAHHTTALTNLRLRYESLVAISSSLPSTLSTPPSFETFRMSPYISSILSSSCQSPATSPTNSTSSNPQSTKLGPLSINSLAFSLAVFGWEAEKLHLSGLATCSACFRRLGLWLFSSPEDVSSSPSSPSMTRLDVVAEHRDYCPWINSVSQSKGFATNQTKSRSPTFDFAGWEILLRVLQNSASSRDKIQKPASVTDTDVEPNRISNEVSDEATEVGSVISEVTSVTQKADPAARDAKDKERWAKLKKLKQAFHVKRGRGKGPAKEKEVVKGKENVEALRGTK